MKPLLLLFALAGLVSGNGISLEGFVGTASSRDKWSPGTDWNVQCLYRFDQMVLMGAGFGYEGLPGRPAGLLDARLQVRLPIGRQLLPYVALEPAAGLRPHLEDTYFTWRGGVGADLKLGDRSSLVAEYGWAAYDRQYGRIGLLLDF